MRMPVLNIETRVLSMALILSCVGYLRILKVIQPTPPRETELWFLLSVGILTICIGPKRLGRKAAAAVWWFG